MIQKFSVFFLCIFMIGCSTTPNIGDEEKLEVNKEINLTINLTPSSAKVRILNIVPRYKEGMTLLKGRYHIEVSNEGYKTSSKWYDLKQDGNLNISLSKLKFNSKGILSWGGFPFYSHLKGTWKIGNLYFIDRAKQHLKYKEALKYCKSFEIVNNEKTSIHWRLPTTTEFQSIRNEPQLEFKIGELDHYKPFWNSEGKIYVLQDNDSFRPKDTSYSVGFGFQAICIADKTEQVKTSIESQLTYLESREFDSIALITPEKPNLLVYPPQKSIKRGEFEKTVDFEQRKILTNKKIQEIKELVDYRNAKIIKNWESQVKTEKSKYKKRKAQLIKNKTNKSQLLLIEKSLRNVYGMPYIRNVNYNADEEMFTFDLHGSEYDFPEHNPYFEKKNIQVPVNIKKAKEFKAFLTSYYYMPIVKFEIKNDELVFLYIKEINDFINTGKVPVINK